MTRAAKIMLPWTEAMIEGERLPYGRTLDYPELVQGVKEVLRERGYELVLFKHPLDGDYYLAQRIT